MKKILLLTLISAFAIAANAQWQDDHRPGRDAPYSNNHFDRRDTYMMDRINHQFDERQDALKSDRYLSRHERRRQLRDLERQRRRALSDCRDGYSRRSENGYGNYYPYNQGSPRDRW